MEEICIRTAKLEDAKRLVEIYTPYVEETAITFEYDVPSVKEFERRIEEVLCRYPYIVAERKGKIVGYAYVHAFYVRSAYDWSVETSVYVDRKERKSGVGRVLYQAIEEICKEMGILNLNACIAMPRGKDLYLDESSAKFHQKLGFSLVGRFHNSGYKFEHWYDMIWMEKMIGEHQKAKPIRAYSSVRERMRKKYPIV